jgi:hypothetical protein
MVFAELVSDSSAIKVQWLLLLSHDQSDYTAVCTPVVYCQYSNEACMDMLLRNMLDQIAAI